MATESGLLPGVPPLAPAVLVDDVVQRGAERAVHSQRALVLRWSLLLLLFWTPVLILATAFELLLWRTGESWTISRVLDVQRRDPGRLFLRRYLDQGLYRYKFLGMLERRPAILALGSSRVMRFRAPMFGDSANFYNAGGLIQNLDDLESFVRLTPDTAMPRVIILGIDMWWLNDNDRSPEGLTSGIAFDGASSWKSQLLTAREMLMTRGALVGAIAAVSPRTGAGDGIGLAARERGEGFRSDGSLTSARRPPENADWHFVDRENPIIPDRIRQGIDRFEPAPALSLARLARLRNVLTTLQRRGVLILGFNPPFSADGAAALESDPRQRELWREYRTGVPALFTELGLPFVDASTTGALGLDDRYMSDGFHAEETFHLYLLRRFAADPRVAAALPGMGAAVERAIASSKTDYWYADFPGR